MKAFPTPTFSISDEARVTSIGGEGGMELRDYFAGKAMSAYIGRPNLPVSVSDDELATACYEMADAMLKARGKC